MAQSRRRRSRRKTVVGEQHPRDGHRRLSCSSSSTKFFPFRARQIAQITLFCLAVCIYYTVMHLRPLLPTSNQRRGKWKGRITRRPRRRRRSQGREPKPRRRKEEGRGEGGILATAPGDQSLLSSFSSLSRLSCRLWWRRKEGGNEKDKWVGGKQV